MDGRQIPRNFPAAMVFKLLTALVVVRLNGQILQRVDLRQALGAGSTMAKRGPTRV